MKNVGNSNTFEQTLERRLSRREFGRTSLIAGLTPLALSLNCAGVERKKDSLLAASGRPGRWFESVEPGIDDKLHVPNGYEAQVLLSWGDPLFDAAENFDAHKQTEQAQLRQFGNNCDFVGYLPIEGSEHGLLCVNHEFNWASMMFPGYEAQGGVRDAITEEHARIEMAALGHSVVEIRKVNGLWTIIKGQRNRRISLLETKIEFSGPVMGHKRLRTTQFPDGMRSRGTMANCSGGVTPWGTVLFCEENFADFFEVKHGAAEEKLAYERYAIDTPATFGQFRFDSRFRVDDEPRAPNHYGWVVEYDPYDPQSVPKKRTALGRACREAATVAVSGSGQVAVYSGDDDYFEYLYKFVSKDKYDPNAKAANADLLDEGILYAAKFNDDGTARWIPLIHGLNGLDKSNGFDSQADVLIEARRAADTVGATKMDRPEDVEANPKTGKVYVMLTKNGRRKASMVDAANPFEDNRYGHVLEISPPEDKDGRVDHAAPEFKWEVLIAGGPVSRKASLGAYHADTLSKDAFACPDNCTFDNQGRLWIATDGIQGALNSADGIFVCGTSEEERNLVQRFLRVPSGAEACGPCFTPDAKTLFVSIQHPGFGKGCTFNNPGTRWPDFSPDVPPRPSVIAVVRSDGGEIGG
ncbi:MAG: PhoX family phosphatase [Myxococcota bacterium]|nr:PhoX family phosphatase [Myxococcota bacterium]